MDKELATRSNPMKQYTVKSTDKNSGRSTEWTGTVDELVENVFGYTLRCNGMGTKFKRPKSAKALVNRLNSGNSYWSMRNSYELVG